jgi:hypothetical protein
MPVWKVLFIMLFGAVCLALALATVIVPISMAGGQRWLWAGGLLSATLGMGTLFALFLRHADGNLQDKPRWARVKR